VSIFDPDHAGADHRQAARQPRKLDDLIAVEYAVAVERHVVRAKWPGAAGDQDVRGGVGAPFAGLRGHLDLVGPDEPAFAARGLDGIAVELVLQDLDLVVERLAQAGHQVACGDVLLDAIGASVEPAFAPAGEVEDGFAQRLRRYRSGVNRYAADPTTFSITSTDLPIFADWTAARRPEGPLPMTIMSYSFMKGAFFLGLGKDSSAGRTGRSLPI
jgi:hypothetical protein